MTLSEKCRLHGLMMPMPDAGRCCCWYCAEEMSGGNGVPCGGRRAEIAEAFRAACERRSGDSVRATESARLLDSFANQGFESQAALAGLMLERIP